MCQAWKIDYKSPERRHIGKCTVVHLIFNPLMHAGAKNLAWSFDKAEFFVKALFVFCGHQRNHNSVARFKKAADIFHDCFHQFSAETFSLIFRSYNYICNKNCVSMIPDYSSQCDSFIIIPKTNYMRVLQSAFCLFSRNTLQPTACLNPKYSSVVIVFVILMSIVFISLNYRAVPPLLRRSLRSRFR